MVGRKEVVLELQKTLPVVLSEHNLWALNSTCVKKHLAPSQTLNRREGG